MTPLQLLAPARDLECGIAAIDCGADAVYIGAPRFGARAQAGNSLDDIKALVEHAHQFGAKVFVTLNTILYEHELPDARQLLLDLDAIDVDAVLVQDMALHPSLREELGLRLHFHASTQTDNRSPEKALWLAQQGFSQIVLARELSLEEIRQVHAAFPSAPILEAFVHGALCVSYSGACYASQHCFGRSANRGECAQFCRMKFDLLDADGNELIHQRHLLSLKDLCLIDRLEDLADAGIRSFKIEGRLKNVSYVRNVVAAYSQALDQLCARRPEKYCRASYGKVHLAFEPHLEKSFNRGFTSYFLDGRRPDIFSPDTPKAIGEFVGRVKEIRGRSFTVAGTASFANGDGLCFLAPSTRELVGFRVNRVEGNRLFPLQMPQALRPATPLFRNNDEAFERQLSRPETRRTIPLNLHLTTTPDGFALQTSVPGDSVVGTITFPHQPAQKPQEENIRRQLSKWGGTIYEAASIDISPDAATLFIPSSILSSLRQDLHAKLQSCPHQASAICPVVAPPTSSLPPDAKNVANSQARAFYESIGFSPIIPAYETDPAGMTLPLMQCRHCIRFSLGHCLKRKPAEPASHSRAYHAQETWKAPLRLRLSDGRLFRLDFDCKNCQMNLYAEK